MRKLKEFVTDFGLPRVIIFLFLMFLFVAAPFVGVRIDTSISDVLTRFGQNGILVLALVPMVQSGTGLNFGLPVGIIAGLLGGTLAMQFHLTGWLGFFGAIAISMPFAIVFGWLYGKLLNRVKGDEMTIAMYVGFSMVTFFSILWLLLPYSNPTMVWGYAGQGLRTTITLDNYWGHILNDFLAIRSGNTFNVPTGMILFVFFCAFLVYLFFRSKTGTAMTAVGSNPDFARAGGVSVDRMRTISVTVSTMLGAVGILASQQSSGFIPLL